MKNKEKIRIGLLVSGGDCQLINYLIGEFIKYHEKYDLYFIYDGFKGLSEGNIKHFNQMIKEKTYNRINIEIFNPISSGSFIRSSRFPMIMDYLEICKGNLRKYKIDKLIILGGNGSSHAAQLFKNTIFIPCTIDNDIPFSVSFGYFTSVQQIVDYYNLIEPSLYAMNKDLFIEVMGNGSNQLSLGGFLASYVDFCILNNYYISMIENDQEKKMQIDKFSAIDSLCNQIYKQMNHDRKKSVFISEKNKKQEIHMNVKKTDIVGYFQRGGLPNCFERKLAVQYVKRIINSLSGVNQTDFVLNENYEIEEKKNNQEMNGNTFYHSLLDQVIFNYSNINQLKKKKYIIFFRENEVFDESLFDQFISFYHSIDLKIHKIPQNCGIRAYLEKNGFFLKSNLSEKNFSNDQNDSKLEDNKNDYINNCELVFNNDSLHVNDSSIENNSNTQYDFNNKHNSSNQKTHIIIFSGKNELNELLPLSCVIIPTESTSFSENFILKNTILNTFCKKIDEILLLRNRKVYFIRCKEWILEELEIIYDFYIDNEHTRSKIIIHNKKNNLLTDSMDKQIIIISNIKLSDINIEKKNEVICLESPCSYKKTSLDEIYLRCSLIEAFNRQEGLILLKKFWPEFPKYS